MQFRLTFRTQRLTLPFSCQHQMQSMIYSLLRRDEVYGVTIHPVSNRTENQAYIPFCFGQFTGKKKINRERKQMTFVGRVFWELRTADPQMAKVFCRLLTPGLTLTLCNQPLILESASLLEKEIPGEQCKIRMLTPILAYERTELKETVPYNPLCREFAPLVVKNFQRKYCALTGIWPEEIGLDVLSVGDRDKNVTNYKGTWLTGWKGDYLLTGKPEYLLFLYDTGLGLRNAAGFGLFEVLES